MQLRKVGPVTVPVDPETPRPFVASADTDSASASGPAALRRRQQDYWPLPTVRAVPAAVAALVITFSAEHSSRFGLSTFAGFAIATGVVILVVARLRLAKSGMRGVLLLQGGVSLLLGVVAFLVRQEGVGALVLTVAVWAAVTGALELYNGIRTRRRHPASGDWITTAGLTLLLAVALFVLPREYAQVFAGPDGVERVLDASIVAVGLLGAYSAIIAVYLLVAGFSAKWGTTAEPDAPPAAVLPPDAAKGELP